MLVNAVTSLLLGAVVLQQGAVEVAFFGCFVLFELLLESAPKLAATVAIAMGFYDQVDQGSLFLMVLSDLFDLMHLHRDPVAAAGSSAAIAVASIAALDANDV